LSIFKQGVHKYSGLDEREFLGFINEIQMFENSLDTSVDQAAGHLYKGINHAQNLGMLSSPANQAVMHELVRSLGVEGERIIMESAKRIKVPFRTIYLKDTL
tara:strand:- start:3309 stop:3614 length:306 start_codon:yes stop_codon:yes gene_type:complete